MSDSRLHPETPRIKPIPSTQEIAIDIVYRLARAVRMSRIYETNNRIFLHQIRQLFELIQSALKAEGQVMFSLRQSSLFFNEHRIKFGFSSYYLFKFMQTSMLEKEIGELIFLPQLAENELTGFVLLLASRRDAGDDVFERFAEKIFKNKLLSIHVEKLPPYEKTIHPEKAAKKIFFLSVTHLKEIFEYQEDNEKRPSVLTTKRLMQSIFNLISENDSFLFGLTNIKNFDEYTLNHSINVCVLSISLGKKIGLDRKELVELGLSAFFHDLGKLDIPKEILEKPGKLNENERRIIERHPYLGAEKLAQLREFRYLPLSALNVAMEHHTRLDDTGYPQYTKKQTINLFSKVVKITDVFDALTTERPYRTMHYSQSDALRYMLKHSGSEFDPILLKVFVNMMGDIPVGTPVLLNSGEIGITWENNPAPQFRLRPKVKLITDENGNLTDGEVVDISETLQDTNTFQRTIIKPLDPKQYHIRVPDFFVAEAE
jgi:HD-GYP domain-containing protein (c-di-GMP phosphodiesterase class II)